MVITQSRGKRKPSGGLYRSTLTKRSHMLARQASMTKVGETERKKNLNVLGNNMKNKLFETNTANIFNPKTKKYEKATVESVAENPANRNFVRRNILTKGTIINTDKGKARITSRPGQDGVINAVLV